MSVTLNELHDAMEAAGMLDCIPRRSAWLGRHLWFTPEHGSQFGPTPGPIAIDAICFEIVKRAAKEGHSICNDDTASGIKKWWVSGRPGTFDTLESACLAMVRAKKKPTRGEQVAKVVNEQIKRLSLREQEGLAVIVDKILSEEQSKVYRVGIANELAAQEAGR